MCAAASAGAGRSGANPTVGKQPTDAAVQTVLQEHRAAELQALEQRSQDAALEVQTLLATVARHKEEVAVQFTPQIEMNLVVFYGVTCL